MKSLKRGSEVLVAEAEDIFPQQQEVMVKLTPELTDGFRIINDSADIPDYWLSDANNECTIEEV